MHPIIFQYVHTYCVRWFVLCFREQFVSSDTPHISNSFLLTLAIGQMEETDPDWLPSTREDSDVTKWALCPLTD